MQVMVCSDTEQTNLCAQLFEKPGCMFEMMEPFQKLIFVNDPMLNISLRCIFTQNIVFQYQHGMPKLLDISVLYFTIGVHKLILRSSTYGTLPSRTTKERTESNWP